MLGNGNAVIISENILMIRLEMKITRVDRNKKEKCLSKSILNNVYSYVIFYHEILTS